MLTISLQSKQFILEEFKNILINQKVFNIQIHNLAMSPKKEEALYYMSHLYQRTACAELITRDFHKIFIGRNTYEFDLSLSSELPGVQAYKIQI